MHRNYFIFERQVSEIQKQLAGYILEKCFTYRKDELILYLSGEKQYFLKIGLKLQKPYLLLTAFQNIREPQTSFFDSIRKQALRDMYILPYDKRVMFDFGGSGLQAIFYGKHPNVILHDSAGRTIASFKKKLGEISGESHLPVLLPRELTEDALGKAIAERPKMHLDKFLTHTLAGFNNQITTEICHRCDLPSETQLQKLHDEQVQELYHTIQSLLSEFESFAPVLYHENTGNVILSICELTHLIDIMMTESFAELNEAWNRFIYLSETLQRYERQYQKAITTVKKRSAYLLRTRRQIESAQDLAGRKAESVLKGKLLQVFAKDIRKGLDTVSLPNIFSSNQKKVKIKLNPVKSVQENARIYFDKYKNNESRNARLEIKIDTLDQELQAMEKLTRQLVQRPPLRKLEKIIQELENRHLVQSADNGKKSDTTIIYSFNRLLLEKKWEVLIGKSAANNDLLTFKYSRKFDLWFHAQSVPGSHVVIRMPNRNEHPPQTVIQEVARIAAYYSSARHSGTVPVNYTEIRYVRKPRKASPGQVLISNEKTIFVTPKKI